MTESYVTVKTVREGMFSSEREVAFDVDGNRVTLIVDKSNVQDRRLRVMVVDRTADRALIQLPGEPFAGGSSSRVFIPAKLLVTR